MEAILKEILPYLVGLFFAGLGGFFWWWNRKLRQECTGQTTGVVSDVGKAVSYKKGKVKTSYRMTYTYSVEGVEYTKQSNTTTGVQKFSVGQSVTVFYDPAKPQRYYISEEGKPVAIILVPITLGVLLILARLMMQYLG